MADPRITQIIRDAGGIVHSDGNIFFTNQAQFLQAASQAQQPAQQTDLHAAIMNLPCSASKYDAEPNLRLAYKIGHRAARHQAAELVAAAPQQPAQQAVRMPLTRERMEAIFHQHMPRTRYTACFDGFGRAIEAAHGIALPPAAKEGEKKQ
jgi:hypothetical protein